MHIIILRNEFAYAASDKLVYIREFSNRGSNMKLSGVLQGHEADVTQVCTTPTNTFYIMPVIVHLPHRLQDLTCRI